MGSTLVRLALSLEASARPPLIVSEGCLPRPMSLIEYLVSSCRLLAILPCFELASRALELGKSILELQALAL